jgi:hypothetical protein
MRISTMSLTTESVNAHNIANSRSGAVWGARGASQSSRMGGETLKPPPIEPISTPKESTTPEMSWVTFRELNMAPAGRFDLADGAVWDAAAVRGSGPVVEPPAGAAWGCRM